MASSVAKSRHVKNAPHGKVVMSAKDPEADASLDEEFPTLTKKLYMNAFPAPIYDHRPEDVNEADAEEFLIPQGFMGSGRMGQAHLAQRRDFTKYACTTAPNARDDMRIVWVCMDARVIDYVDAVRIRKPFIVNNKASPFICKVLLSFRSRLPFQIMHYHLICEYWTNQKSLCAQLHNVGKLPETGAKFYLMELADAVFYIHSFNKILRRLCMCCLLTKANGHLLLSPYTMCKQNLDCGQACNMLTSNCGDQFYASPEVVFGVDVLSVTDWWSYGVIIYQMLTSELPFHGRTLGDLGKAITEAPLEVPSTVSPEATAIIKQFLHRDPRRRLGYGRSGQNDIERHPFFAGIDWRDIRSLTLEIEPPFKSN